MWFKKKKADVSDHKCLSVDYYHDMGRIKPIVGGYLYQGFTIWSSWSKKMPQSINHHIKIDTEVLSEYQKYAEILRGYGYQGEGRTERNFSDGNRYPVRFEKSFSPPGVEDLQKLLIETD